MTDDEALSAVAPTFTAISLALRSAAVPEALRDEAFEILMAMGGDLLTSNFPARYAEMVRLVEEHPELQPLVTPHLGGLAHLLH